MSPVRFEPVPSIEKRRQFANIPFNAHVTDYSGFVPQIRFRQGKSQTRLSQDAADELPYYTGPTSKIIYEKERPTAILPKKGLVFEDEFPGQKVPLSDGHNKYFNDMIPGFSGDIMRSPFHFGKRYRAMTQDCIDEFINEHERQQAKREDVEKHSTMFPALRPILGDPRVRDHMNLWVDADPNRPILLEDKRGPREAAMCGYTGYIPRKKITETGLGVRYHAATENSANAFRDEVERHQNNLKVPYPLKQGSGDLLSYTEGPARSLAVRSSAMPIPDTRIYRKEGMVPGYRGVVPEYYICDGYNFGDGTRRMRCCSHDMKSFGHYLKTQS